MPLGKKGTDYLNRPYRSIVATLFRNMLCAALVFAAGAFIIAKTSPEPGRWLTSLVRHFDGVVRSGIRSFQEKPDLLKLLHFGWFSLLYGFIHSAGPGHGKALVGAFFLRKPHSPGKAFVLAGVIAFVHTIGAVILSFAFATLLKGLGIFFRVRLQGYIIAASGALIAVIGLSMLFYKLMGRKPVPRSTSVETGREESAFESPFLLGAAAGIVPCPAAMMLMLFSISHGIVPFGIFSVLAMSLGMFLLLSVIGILTVKGRERLLHFAGGRGMERIGTVLEYCSLSLIALIGVLMTASILA